MGSGMDEYLKILHEAWISLLDDYGKIYQWVWYVHEREEDIRSYLFCKILNILKKRRLEVMNLHVDIPIMNRKRADIVLGSSEDIWNLGVEIKRSISHAIMEEQLNKLGDFIANKKIDSGVFLAIIQHSYNLKEMLEYWGFKEKFKLEERDKGNNNFIEWRRIIVKDANIDWDTLFLVLRTL